MTRPATHAARRPFGFAIGITVATVAVTLFGGVLLATPAGAAVVIGAGAGVAQTASTAEVPVASTAASIPGLGIAKGLSLGVEGPGGGQIPGSYNFVSDPATGYVTIVEDGPLNHGACVTITHVFPFGNGYTDRPCNASNIEQKFYFVPVASRPNANANTSADDHHFYVVGAGRNECFTLGGPLAVSFVTCDASNHFQKMYVVNDNPNPLGIALEWQAVLGMAVGYASNHCVAYSPSCQVSPNGGSFAGQWFQPDDPAVLAAGTLTSKSIGCGTPELGKDSKVQNRTSNPETETVTTSQSLTNSYSVSNTYTGSIAVEGSYGSKDVWGIKVTGSFAYERGNVTTVSRETTLTKSSTITVDPGSWLMGSWSQQVFTLDGQWKLGLDTPSRSAGSLTWYIPATSQYAASVNNGELATFAPTTSHSQKNCDAGPAAVNAAAPVPTSDPATCGDATPAAPSGAVGSTVYACPGVWNIPSGSGSTTPQYRYQWFLTAGGTDTAHPIAGATNSTFTIQPSTFGSGTLFLGVSVYEAGPPERLESGIIPSQVTVTLTPPTAPTTGAYPTNFTGAIPEATPGTAYAVSLVASAGTDMSLTGNKLPAGFTLSPEGLLTGTPTTPGTFPFSVTDSATPGRDAQTVDYTLTVLQRPATFSSTNQITATVGQPVSKPLVTSNPDAVQFRLESGTLPAGLTLDSNGELAGIPTVSGTYIFGMSDTGGSAAPQAFTVHISDTSTTFVTVGLPNARVGSGYAADTVAVIGSNPLIGFVGDTTPALFDGLTIDATTGTISGTPTSAGTVTLSIGSLTDPGGPVLTTRLVIEAAVDEAVPTATAPAPVPEPRGSEQPGASHPSSELAATGLPLAASLSSAMLMAGAGVALLAVRRRRRRHRHNGS